MTRKCVWLIAAVLALIPLTFARGETARNLIRKYGSEAQYNLSAIPELLKLNANVFFVDNEATNALDAADGRHGQTPDQPFATYDYAISQCTAGQDNVIVILPYSTERYTGAGSVDVDVSGITTIGLGYGPARPKFVWDNAAATFIVGAAGDGATFQNLTFQASVTGVTVGVQIEDNADNVSFIDCEWLDGELSGTDEFVTAVDVVLEVNDLTFENCRWTSLVAGATAAIDIGDGAAGGFNVLGCYFYGDYASAHITSDQAITRALIQDSFFYNSNADEFGFELQGTSNTGICTGCTIVTSGNYVDAGGLAISPNVGFKTIGDSDTTGVTYSIADGGITAAKIATDAVDADAIADSSIDAGAIAANAITTAEIATGAISSDEVADNAIDAGAIATDAITADKIAASAITSSELATDAIGGDEIAAGAIGASEIAASAIDADSIAADAITSSEIAADAIGAAEIAADAITNAEIANDAIGATEIATGAIDADAIAADALTTAEIATGAISNDEIATDAIGAAEIASGAIAADEIATDAIGAAEIAANAIGADEIATDAIGAAEIAASAIGADEIAASAIAADEIATDAIGAAEIAASAIGADEIATDAIGAAEIASGAIAADEIATDAIGAAEIAANAIGTAELATDCIAADELAATAIAEILGTTLNSYTTVHQLGTVIHDGERCISKVLTGFTNGNQGLFTVAGGPIKLIEIVAYVTTEIGGEGNLMNYNINPTTPATDTAFGTDGTAVETNAAAVGSLLTWDGVVANDLVLTANGVALGCNPNSGLIIPPGGIELATANDGTVSGAVTVYLRYKPLAAGVTVVAQ